MSYQFYNLLHLFGIFLLFVALGGLFLHAINGGTKESNSSRKLVAISHGVALFLILLAGFGMLARIEMSAAEPWVLIKLGIWLLMGAALVIPYRAPQLARPLWLMLPLLGLLAAWTAVNKPGYEPEVPAPASAEEAAVEESGSATTPDAEAIGGEVEVVEP